MDGTDPGMSDNINGDFPLARATGVCVSGANRVEVNSYALLRRSNWSQLGRCSQREDRLQYGNLPMLSPEFLICRLVVETVETVAVETTKLPHMSQPQCRCQEWVCKCVYTLCSVVLTTWHGSPWGLCSPEPTEPSPSSMAPSLRAFSTAWMYAVLPPAGNIYIYT